MRLRLLLVLVVFAACVCSARAQTSVSGDSAPNSIRLEGADGKTYDFKGMRGHVLLVSFGATWCEPCKEELKALEQLKKEYKDKPVKFLWVSIEDEEEVSDGDLRNYAKKIKFSFPILRDPDRSTFARYSGRLRLPTTLFFDKAGRHSLPNHVGIGAVNQFLSRMRDRLDRLLAAQAATNQAGGH
jgi:thiol-disulfide isomerase/thioredoxin